MRRRGCGKLSAAPGRPCGRPPVRTGGRQQKRAPSTKGGDRTLRFGQSMSSGATENARNCPNPSEVVRGRPPGSPEMAVDEIMHQSVSVWPAFFWGPAENVRGRPNPSEIVLGRPPSSPEIAVDEIMVPSANVWPVNVFRTSGKRPNPSEIVRGRPPSSPEIARGGLKPRIPSASLISVKENPMDAGVGGLRCRRASCGCMPATCFSHRALAARGAIDERG